MRIRNEMRDQIKSVGFLIPAQLKLLRENAAVRGLTVAQKYVDIEAAKQTGRVAFGEMIARLARQYIPTGMAIEGTLKLGLL